MNTRSQLLGAAGAFVVALAYATTEMRLIAPGDLGAQVIAARAAATFGFLPAFIASPLLTIISRRDDELVRRLPPVLTLGALLLAVLLHPPNWLFAVALGIVCGVGFARIEWLRTPDETVIRTTIAGALLALVFWLTANLHWAHKDGGDFVFTATSTIILLIAPGATFAPVAYRVLDAPRVRTLLTVLLWVGAVAAAVFVAQYDFALYVPPKLFVVAALGLIVMLDAMERHDEAPPTRLSIALLTVAFLAAVTLRLQPVPQRFGPAPLDSYTGLAAALFSVGDDRDLDGFYDERAGGNDCEPHKPSTVLDIAGCAAGSARTQPRESTATISEPARHGFVFIVDALRPDVAAETSEGFDELRERGVLFEHAYAPGNRTYSSFRPMLSGVAEPVYLQAKRDDGEFRVAIGREFGMFHLDPISHTVFLHSTMFPGEPDGYLAQEPLVRAETALDTGSVVDAAESWLRRWRGDGGDGRIVMALYTRDPHAPYVCDDSTIGDECYREEVGEVGRGLARFLALLEELALLDDSVVVVLGDHGEAFGEHGHYFHASSLHEEQVRVPIFLLHPQLSPAETVTDPVSAIALAATVSHALGVRQPTPFRSLLAVADGSASPRPPVMHDLRDHDRPLPPRRSAVVVGEHKLIYDWNSNSSELFDLAADPDERDDLAGAQPEQAELLRETLFREIVATASLD